MNVFFDDNLISDRDIEPNLRQDQRLAVFSQVAHLTNKSKEKGAQLTNKSKEKVAHLTNEKER